MQGRANSALARIEEKTSSIDRHFGGAFDKALDAAIGKAAAVDTSFEALNAQLEQTAKELSEAARSEIGAVGSEERARIEEIVNQQISNLRARVEATREAAEEAVERPAHHPFLHPERTAEQIVAIFHALGPHARALLKDLAIVSGQSLTGVLRNVRLLQNRGVLSSDEQGFYLLADEANEESA